MEKNTGPETDLRVNSNPTAQQNSPGASESQDNNLAANNLTDTTEQDKYGGTMSDATPATSSTIKEDSTTTTKTTPSPTVHANSSDKKPNVKGDADSSSSISSMRSVWVRVPLLIVVTLACILLV
ncbi:hypothetical protein LSM04_003910 [Trypanosoma melophagium]|uniref:uncharacterized protein n=1 Tax=Trypanosoma melophagium TaxID=715481 RepID=UPI00351A5051|nr:hypothetical protein LSM04_003910 [Trypanosoma melophagium]